MDRALSRPWWHALWAVNTVVLVGTVLAATPSPYRHLFRPLHLGIEGSIATWWSGMQLLLFGLLAHSNALALHRRDRLAARAWLTLAVIGLGLFADEIGSIHERAMYFLPIDGQIATVPLAALVGVLLSTSLIILHRRRARYGQATFPILLALLLLSGAYMQEMIEHRRTFSGLGFRLRIAFEEGTELAGMFLLLVAAARTRRSLGPAGETPLIPGAKTIAWVTAWSAALAVPAVFFRRHFTAEELELPRHGDFGMILPILLSASAALLAWSLARAGGCGQRGWLALAGALAILSMAAEVHPHRYLLGYVSWRYDLDLLVGLPLLGLSAVWVPPLRQVRVFLALGFLLGLAALSVFVIPEARLAIALFHGLSLMVAAYVLWLSRSADGPPHGETPGKQGAPRAIDGRGRGRPQRGTWTAVSSSPSTPEDAATLPVTSGSSPLRASPPI